MQTSIRWACPTELTAEERRVAQALHRIGKFYVFLREVRAELFDDGFQAELAAAYQPRGTAPVPPALLAMVTLLQAYDQVGDAEAVLTAQFDARWQLVLGCLGATKAPFSQGVLVKFRARMIAHDLDRKLLTRTIELARRTGQFGWQRLHAALDSSPLLGAGRIEDTWNLIGRALGAVVTCAAKAVNRPRAHVIAEAGLTLLGRSSLKAALDIDWDDPGAQAAALERLLREVDRVEQWVAAQAAPVQAAPALQAALARLRAVLTQDLEPDPTTGRLRILHGVAKGRQPSLGDPEMRHGRKSRSRPFTGYKRHVVKLREPDLIVEAIARPANEPEHLMLAPLTSAVAQQGPLTDLWMDRGYLSSPEIPALRARGVTLHTKPWTARNGERFPKHAFTIRLAEGHVECPTHQTAPLVPGRSTVQFAAETCRVCPVRNACTTAANGRSITLHPQEALLQELRATLRTPDGRADLRQRTTVEHSLARLDQTQGKRARYKGARKNTLDLRRCATVVNLQRLARLDHAA
jgi:IS5 family transposase